MATMVRNTSTGIVCAQCSYWATVNGKRVRVEVRHASVADIRACTGKRDIVQPLSRSEVRAANSGYASALPDPAAAFAADFPAPASSRPKISWADVRVVQAKLPNQPHMRYAVRTLDFNSPDPEPVWKFYRIDKPNKGTHAGKTFVWAQASDEFHRVTRPERIIAICEAIAADPQKAAVEYGKQLGECSMCGRTLTDADSIAAGIGPICAAKAGW